MPAEQDGGVPAIDRAHLSGQTMGDDALAAEILAMFVRQSQELAARIAGEPAADQRANLAHTLKGSARVVGAWRVADAAGRIEQGGEPGDADELHAAVRDAVAAIGRGV